MLSRRIVFTTVLLAACVAASAQQPTTLKDAYRGVFHVGAAINERQIAGTDTVGLGIIKAQFDTISPENVLKWERVHPKPDTYNFDLADKYVEFGEKNHMFIVGHNLVWHSQVPNWVFQDDQGKPVTREVLLKRMHDHIFTVVGRYKGRIQSWDVVNEALNEDGTLRKSKWQQIIGDDFIEKAFEYAHEADPQAELNYNDYSLENEAKLRGALALVAKLKADGIPITTVGIQGHDSLEFPTLQQEDAAITAFARLGVKIAISELDIDVLPRNPQLFSADVSLKVQQDPKLNPYANGLPDDVQQALAKRYAGLFAIYLKHRAEMSRVTFWGVTDGDSWLNNWPVRGRTSYPLLFDRSGKPKPAFDAVIGQEKLAGKR
ncbi:MAG: endo-1,4-beta-xylanase [Terracidiphilus sp.]|jgi:endo-1,4-beta-xylanase